ncbi:MAG TPA: DHA2 family efflux MFS transporter permease subunit [Candidatus Baltobacteraceae bacterium]|jgi:DHA2 family multidrug resistance protein
MAQQDLGSNVVEYGSARVIVVIGVMLATLLQTLDTTIVNVALPTIQGNLGATIDEGAWIVTGYIISAVVIIPLTPWLQLRFGRRQYYATAIFGFTIASMLCGISSSIEQLIFWRIVQGAFGGGLIATGQATLRDTFPKAQLGASQAIFALGAIVGPSVGPYLGGLLTDNYAWNWVFFINLVPGTLAGIIVLMRLRNPTEPRKLPIDAIGLSLLAIGLGSLQYVLGQGERSEWFDSGVIRFFVASTAAALIAFVWWELRTNNPVVDLRVLKFRSVWSGSMLAFTVGASLYGAIVILPQYVQGILGFTATLSGELIFVRAICIAITTIPIANLVGRGKLDARLSLGIGFLLLSVSNYLQCLDTTSISTFWTFLWAQLTGGVGLGMLFVPISIAVLSAVPQDVAPKAVAFTSLSLQLGGSISTAILVTLLDRRAAAHLSDLAGNATLRNPAVAEWLAHRLPLAQLFGIINREALTLAFADASMFLALLSLVLAPLVFLIRKPAPHNPQQAQHVSIEAA